MSRTSNNPVVSDEMLDEAADWLAQLDGAPHDAALRAGFRTWLDRDVAHAVAADVVTRSWQAAGGVARAAVEAPVQLRGNRAGARQRSLRPSFATAAMLVLLLAGAVLLWRLESVAPVTYQTARGEQVDVQLPDGSRLRLDAATRLTARITWRTRQIELLDGQAEFVVAHESWRPFTVGTERVVVRATGTDFTVARSPDSTLVVLVSGQVELREPASDKLRAVLKPGQKAIYDAATSPVIRNVDSANELAWRSGQVVFDRTTIATALRVFQRYTPNRVAAAAEIEQLQISGIYRTNDLPAFLDSVTKILPIAWSRDAGGDYQLYKREPVR